MTYKNNKMFWALAIAMCITQASEARAIQTAAASVIRATDSLSILAAEQINPTTIDLLLSNQKRMEIISFVYFLILMGESFATRKRSQRQRYLSIILERQSRD